MCLDHILAPFGAASQAQKKKVRIDFRSLIGHNGEPVTQERHAMTIETLAGAYALAHHGLHVVKLHFPLFRQNADGSSYVRCSCGNPDCAEKGGAGKHPVLKAWGKAATCDPEVIRDQWGDQNWNVGILLGTAHGIPVDQAVIDVEDDTAEGRQLAETLLGDLPTVSWSSGKSIHRLYRFHAGLPGVAKITIRGLEWRIGGTELQTQSVAPPSLHSSGQRYQWLPGRSIDEISIATLPDYVVEWLNREYGQQVVTSSGPSTGSHKRFAVPGQKIQEPGRNNALYRHACACWREACRLHGLNELRNPEVRDAVWTRVAGANLFTCDPPLSDEEAWACFVSAETFMLEKALIEELNDAQVRRRQLEAPELPPAPAVEHGPVEHTVADAAEGAVSVPPQPAVAVPDQQSEGISRQMLADSRNVSMFLATCGIRLEFDPNCPSHDDNPDRINQWVCDWQLSYIESTEKGGHRLKIKDWVVDLLETDLDRPRVVARAVYQATRGAVVLDRTFAWFNWPDIWNGVKTKKNGIIRGLREYLENSAELAAAGDDGLESMVQSLIMRLVGAPNSIAEAYHQMQSQSFMSRNAPVPLKELESRLKLGPDQSLIMMWQEGDPTSGVYLWRKELYEVVLLAEVSAMYGKMYGRGSVGVKELSKVMRQLNFEPQNFKRGRVEGRTWVRKVEFSENSVD